MDEINNLFESPYTRWLNDKRREQYTINLPEVEVNQPIHQLPTATVSQQIHDLPEATIYPSSQQAFYHGVVRPRLNKKVRLDIANEFDRGVKTKGAKYSNEVLDNFNRLYIQAGRPFVRDQKGSLYYNLDEAHGSEPYNANGNIYNTSNYKDMINQLVDMANKRRHVNYNQRPSME